jgi:hypothetical protein
MSIAPLRVLSAARRRLARTGDDTGVVLAFVVITMMVVTMFVTAGLAYTVQSQTFARGNQDRNAALAAAQAGVDDYIAHLNRNDNYARQSPFNDCTNLAMRGPKAPANSCGWGPTTAVGWTAMNAGDPAGPAFHYDVNASRLDSTGVVDVKSTGRVGTATRTLQVAVGRGGSTDFLYYTDHEDADPANKLAYPTGANADCYSYWWGKAPDQPAGGRAPRSTYSSGSRCSEITFIGGDVLDGRVHLNDTPLLSSLNGVKPQFKQGLETSDPKCQGVVRGNASTYSLCDRTKLGANYGTSAPEYASPLYLPDNSAAFAGYPGCQYKGATRIVFNPDGTMTVWSKHSVGLPVACGGNSPMGTTVPVPTEQVIYVSADTTGVVRQCLAKEIDGTTLPLGTWTNDTTVSSYTYDLGMTLPDQFCGQGNVYVQGTLQGRVTVAAENSIVATGDLRLQGGLNGSDILGLVAGNSVEVYHPILGTWSCQGTATRKVGGKEESYCTGYSQNSNPVEVAGWPVHSGTPGGIEIQASIQTLQHSFFVQNYNRGSARGTLTVWGSIAQKWRGIVGTGSGSTGYIKNYRYDKRLRYSSPPYFPQFLNASWQGKYTGEIPPQYPG